MLPAHRSFDCPAKLTVPFVGGVTSVNVSSQFPTSGSEPDRPTRPEPSSGTVGLALFAVGGVLAGPIVW